MTRARRLLGLLLLLVSVGMLAWALRPMPEQRSATMIYPEDMALPPPEGVALPGNLATGMFPVILGTPMVMGMQFLLAVLYSPMRKRWKRIRPGGWLALTLALSVLLLAGLACSQSTGASPPPEEPSEGAAPTQAPGEPAQPPSATQLPAPTEPSASAPTPAPAVPEQRLLVLEWPPDLRVGDADLVRVTLLVDEEGKITPTAEAAGNTVQGTPVEIPNLYETHNVVAEASLEMAGLEMRPQNSISSPMQPGQAVAFIWSVRAASADIFRGVVWVRLHFIPLDGSAETTQPLYMQPIEMSGVNLIGLSGPAARVAGGVGLALGSVLSLDNVVGWTLGFFKKRRRPPTASPPTPNL